MTATLAVLAFAIALVAAIRGTWSPCGLSMLASINPMTERSRGHRYGRTAAWFVVGAAAGGASLGAGAAAGAAIVRGLGLPVRGALALAAAAAVVGAASDLELFGFRLPLHPRQVDETWLRKYRTWVYAGGFGWQIGSGFSTYIMSAAVYLTAGLAVLTASPLLAFTVCVTFGTIRGLAVLLTATATSPSSLAAVHRLLDALEPTSRTLALSAQAVAAVIAGTLAAGLPLGIDLAGAAITGLVAVVVVRVAIRREPRPRSHAV